MFERFYVVFHSYRRWYLLRLLLAVLTCVWFMNWYIRDKSLSPIYHLALLSLILIPYSVLLGFRMKSQFDPYRSRLIPGWSATHILVAVGQSVLLAVSLAAISSGASLSGGPGNGWSIAGTFGILWFELLLFFSLGYFFHPIFLALAIALPLVGFGGDRFQVLFSMITDGRLPMASLLLIVLNAAGTTALLRRMLRAHEEMPEFQWYVFNPVEAQRQHGTSESPEQGFRNRLAAWATRSLDSFPRRLGEDFRSQIRHFEFGLTAPTPFWILPICFVLIFWTVTGLTGIQLKEYNLIFLNVFPIWTPLFQRLISQKKTIEWIFMLPLRREKIVVRYLGAMFSSTLKGWISGCLAMFLLNWMPSPGVIGEVPNLLPMLHSFALLLPIFGIILLILTPPTTGNITKRVVTSVAVGTILTIVIAAVIARSTGIYHSAPVFTIALAITGSGLIWYSYRRWLQADLG